MTTIARARVRRVRPAVRRGMTLVEALLASVILAVAVAAISQAVLAGQMQAYHALHRRRAVDLAEALMEEVLRLPYNDPDGTSSPGPEAGETDRGRFDNIDDYNGFGEAAGTLVDLADAPYDSAYQGFSRSVTVAAASETVAAFGSAIPGMSITVAVTDDSGTTWTLQQFVPEPVE